MDAKINKCKCGEEPELIQWHDTAPPHTNATWIECKCGMLTVSFYSKYPEKAVEKAVKMWNKAAKKRKKIKGGLKSCEKCGSTDIEFRHYSQPKKKGQPKYEVNFIICKGCGLCTDDLKPDGSIMSEKDVKELWNS